MGNDHFSVAWQPAGTTNWTIIPAEAPEPAGLNWTAPAQAQMLLTLTEGYPRLLASEAKFAWLKQTLALGIRPQLNSWWNSVRSSADTILTQTPNVYSPDNRGTILGISRSVIESGFTRVSAKRGSLSGWDSGMKSKAGHDRHSAWPGAFPTQQRNS